MSHMVAMATVQSMRAYYHHLQEVCINRYYYHGSNQRWAMIN